MGVCSTRSAPGLYCGARILCDNIKDKYNILCNNKYTWYCIVCTFDYNIR